VDVLEAAQDLVDKVLVVLVRQRLHAADDPVEITLVQLGDDVERIKLHNLGRAGHDIHDFDDVVMTSQMAQQLDLPQDALRIDEVRKHLANPLDGDFAPSDLQQGR
jgi:hypothetical protein